MFKYINKRMGDKRQTNLTIDRQLLDDALPIIKNSMNYSSRTHFIECCLRILIEKGGPIMNEDIKIALDEYKVNEKRRKRLEYCMNAFYKTLRRLRTHAINKLYVDEGFLRDELENIQILIDFYNERDKLGVGYDMAVKGLEKAKDLLEEKKFYDLALYITRAVGTEKLFIQHLLIKEYGPIKTHRCNVILRDTEPKMP